MPIYTSSQFDLRAQLPLRKYTVVSTVNARDNIPTINRYDGFITYVAATNMNYQLQGGITNSDWVAIVSDGTEKYLSAVTVNSINDVDFTIEGGTDILGIDFGHTHSHTELTDIGTNTHAAIDTHIADSTIHFDDLSSFTTDNLTEGALNFYSRWEFIQDSGGIYYNDANVAIGQVTADHKLDVNGDIRATENLYIGTTTAPTVDTGTLNALVWDDTTGEVKQQSISGINYWTKTVNDLSYSDGNVGIGTSPTSILELLETNINGEGASLRIINNGSGVGSGQIASLVMGRSFDERNWKLFSKSTADYGTLPDLIFTTNQNITGSIHSEVLRIKNNGNVLIGTTTDAGYKLDVAGTGRFTSNLLLDSYFGFSTAGVTNIDRILDEDSFTSNSAIALATQQSIKAYVDNAVVGYEWIVASVVAATTSNITISTALNNGDIIDGVTLSTGDYVLVKDQTDKTQNGLYEVLATPARAPEMDAPGEFKSKAMLVTGGTENGGSSWVCTTTVTTLGTDDIEFAKLSQSTSYSAGTGIDLTGSTISLAHLGIEDLIDPNADRIMFWDDSVNAMKWLAVDSTLNITATTLSASLSDINYWTKTVNDLSYSDGAVTIDTILNVRGAIDLADNDILRFGTSDDVEHFFNATYYYTDINTGGKWRVRNGTASKFEFDTLNGRFGVNKINPEHTLDVAGDGKLTGNLKLDSGLYFGATLEDKISLYDNRLGATNMYGLGVESGYVYFKTYTGYRWYQGSNADAGVSAIMSLTGTGLDVAGTGNFDSDLTAGGDITVGGGLYPSTNYGANIGGYGESFANIRAQNFFSNARQNTLTVDQYLSFKNYDNTGDPMQYGVHFDTGVVGYGYIGTSSNITNLRAYVRGKTELYYNTTKRLETTSTGIDVTGNVTASGTVTATNFILSSDIKLKENIIDLEYSDIKTFNFKKDANKLLRYGVIAQELEVKHPEMVYHDSNDNKQVAYIDYLLMKMAEKDKQIAELQRTINKD